MTSTEFSRDTAVAQNARTAASPTARPIDLDLVARIREEAAAEISDVRRADAGLDTEEISPEDEAARAEP